MFKLFQPRICCFNTTNVVFDRALSTSQLKEYYSILNVSRASTPKEIKESFLKLSKVYHPDNNITGSHSKFVRLKEAYDALKDGSPKVGSSYSSQDENIDYSHKAYARYREQQRDYYDRPRPQGYGFGGPYARSSTPWEDMMKERTYNRRRHENPYERRGPLVNITLVLSGLAMFVIYSSMLVVFDFNDNIRNNMKVFKSHNRDYQAYMQYLANEDDARLKKLQDKASKE